MSEVHEQHQNLHPRGSGSGTGSVPVLFSLRNVQPAIVSGTTIKTQVDQSLPKTQASDVAVVPAVVLTNDAEPSKIRNQMVNGAILVLVLLLMALAYSNLQGRNNDKSLTKEPNKASSPDKIAADPRGGTFQPIRFQSIEPLDIGVPPIPLSSNSDPKLELIGTSPIESTSETDASLTDVSIAASNDLIDSSDSNTWSATVEATRAPSGPFLLAASGATGISANPSVHSPVEKGSPREILQSFPPSENKSASFASPAPDAIVDTGVKPTTRQLIDAYITKQAPANSAFAIVPAKPVSNKTIANDSVANDSVASGPSKGGTPYAPLGNELSLTNTSSVADQTAQSKAKEYQPLYPYEQNAINHNSTGFPVMSTEPQSQAIRQPTLNGSNRYQGQPTQQPAYAPYQSMAPAQGANSVGYPPSN